MTQSKSEKILIVDDSPESIAVLNNALPKQYKRQVALSGANALKLLDGSEELPDLILLDVIMPEMDGYEVSKRIKSNIRTKKIPILFISSLNETFDKVKAFKVDGMDFITKPFQVEEIRARVETHMEIESSRKEIQELYSKTLQGTITALNDMMSLVNSDVSQFSNTMKSYAQKIVKKLSLKNTWDLNLACQLSGIGRLTEPIINHVDDDKNANKHLDKEKINEHIVLSAQVVENIPRLDSIILILKSSLLPLNDEDKNKALAMMSQTILKGHIIRILFHFFYKLRLNSNHILVIKEMKNDEEERYNVEILDVIKEIHDEIFSGRILEFELCQMKPGMMLAEDIVTETGRVLLKAGYELTDSIISILKNYPELKERKFRLISDGDDTI